MSLFGGLFGDSKDADPTRAPNELAQLSKQLFSETSPLRTNLINQYTNFTSPGPLTAGEQNELTSLLALRDAPARTSNQDLINAAIDRARRGKYVTSDAGDTTTSYIWSNPSVSEDQIVSDIRRVDPDLFNLYNRENPGISDAQLQRLQFLENRLNDPGEARSGFDVTTSPLYGAMKSAVEKQFSRARQNVLASTPRGGGLTSALANLEGARAGTLATGTGDLFEREMARAFALGTGQTPVALSGLGSAAGSLASIGAAQQAQQAQALQGIGVGVGSTIARKAGQSATTSGGAKAGGSAATAAAAL